MRTLAKNELDNLAGGFIIEINDDYLTGFFIGAAVSRIVLNADLSECIVTGLFVGLCFVTYNEIDKLQRNEGSYT